MRTVIKVETPAEFFKRGKAIARLADQGKAISREHIIAFEDPEDMARLITTAKLALVDCSAKTSTTNRSA